MSQPSEELEAQPFEILEVKTREYSRFNKLSKQWKVRLNPFPETPLQDPLTHFVDSVNNFLDHVLENVVDADIVGITIHNELNQGDERVGLF